MSGGASTAAPRALPSIAILTPAKPGSRAGNRVSALRFARLFRSLGFRARVLDAWDGRCSDLLVVLHARRGARALLQARSKFPRMPIVLVLTGTDVYGRTGFTAAMRRALDAADRIVGLQAHSVACLPRHWRLKARTILQSYDGPWHAWRPPSSGTRFLVLGHLRPEKDPFRAALAARSLPADSTVSVLHAGRALSPSMQQRAQRESAGNPRYQWLGELSRARALKQLARATALVLTSRIEGGPSVFSEALALGVPILSSRIPAARAILGARHPGLFTPGHHDQLAALMQRMERDSRLVARLAAHSRRLAPQVAPAREIRAWERLLLAARSAASRRSG